MEEQDRTDLLVSETVDDLRQVFLVDHAFPTEWEPDEQKKTTRQAISDWFRKVLGFRREAGGEGDQDRGGEGSA